MKFDKSFSECSQDETDYKCALIFFNALFVQSWLHSERFLSDSVDRVKYLKKSLFLSGNSMY